MKQSRAFTLIELLVVIAIIAILAAILFPVFAQAKRAAKTSAGVSNGKQLSLGIIMYAGDYDDTLPTAVWTADYNPGRTIIWDKIILPYIKNGPKPDDATGKTTGSGGVFENPNDPLGRNDNRSKNSWAVNAAPSWARKAPWVRESGEDIRAQNMGVFESPSDTIMLTERPHYWSAFGWDPWGKWVFAPVATDWGCSWLNAQTGTLLNGSTCDNDAAKAPINAGGWVYAFGDGSVKVQKPQATIGPAGSMDWPYGRWSLDSGD